MWEGEGEVREREGGREREREREREEEGGLTLSTDGLSHQWLALSPSLLPL